MTNTENTSPPKDNPPESLPPEYEIRIEIKTPEQFQPPREPKTVGVRLTISADQIDSVNDPETVFESAIEHMAKKLLDTLYPTHPTE